ncbi:MAG: type II toxin-antitoxin system HicB family antitoxin [Bacteroidales bacterium]|nr:type II toxin-antitoxin system HicB family antitoxin [Bacteroidales bacterium]
MKKFHFTALIEKGENGFYVGQVEEVPEAISQGKTIEELKANLSDALKMVFEAKKELTLKGFAGKKTIRRKIELA